jgi:Leucine-rich repeat (LRR) protein
VIEAKCSANCSYRSLTSIPDNIPSEINLLDLSYNELENEDLQTLDKFTDFLVNLILSYNNLTYIPPNLLSTVSILRELSLEGNILEYVNSTSFENLIRLRKLIGIRSLHFDSNTFEHLNGLDELSIVFDSTNFDENIFNHLNLNTLDIEFKLIQQIPTNIFRFGVDTLLHLRIDAPNVEILHEDTFSGLTILRSITIKSKIMNTLPSFIFHADDNDDRNMPNNLVTVVINGVKSLPRDLFDKQQSLKKLSLNNIEDMFLFDPESQIDTLDLSGSFLYRINYDWFSSFKSLRFLNLSRTQIHDLHNNSFSTLLSLTNLDLSFNNITDFPKGLFKASINTLFALNVSNNLIKNVSMNTFESLKSLEKLDMGHNALNYIDEHAFADLFMLTELVLDDNKIVHLSSDTLFDQSNLMDLRIARNTITELPPKLFRNVHSLKRLDISGNNIQTLPQDLFESVYHLEYLSLSGNPVHCDCSFMSLREGLPRVNIVGSCQSPPDLFDTKLTDLKVEDSCLVTILSTSYSYSHTSPVMSETLHLNNFPTSIYTTPYDQAILSVYISSTSAQQLYPTTVLPNSDRDTTERTLYTTECTLETTGRTLDTTERTRDTTERTRDTAEGTLDTTVRTRGDHKMSLQELSALYIALSCIAAVCVGALLVVLHRTGCRITSGIYEISQQIPMEGTGANENVPPDDVGESIATDFQNVCTCGLGKSIATVFQNIPPGGLNESIATDIQNVPPGGLDESIATDFQNVSLGDLGESIVTDFQNVPPDNLCESIATDVQNVPPGGLDDSIATDFQNVPPDNVCESIATDVQNVPPDNLCESIATDFQNVPTDGLGESIDTDIQNG